MNCTNGKPDPIQSRLSRKPNYPYSGYVGFCTLEKEADKGFFETKQVEPQEKKKTPKGRAKKRITYTRRFVNVTMTGGKRKVSSHVHISFATSTLSTYQIRPPGMGD